MNFDDGAVSGFVTTARGSDIALLLGYSSNVEDEIANTVLHESPFNTAPRTSTLITCNSLLIGSLGSNVS